MNVKTELFEIARDYIDAIGLIVFVIEGLIPDLFQILGIGALKFDHGECFAVFEDSPVSFLAILDVFEFGGQVVIRIGIDRVAEDIDKQLSKKSLLKLFFLGSADICPTHGIVEVGQVRSKSGMHRCMFLGSEVFFKN